jgi:hypothetical protein
VAYLTVGLVSVLCLVFAVSAISKLRSRTGWRAFVTSLRDLGLLPGRLVAPVAVLVAGAEVVLAIGLACTPLGALLDAPWWRPVGIAAVVATLLLLSVLTVGIRAALRRGSVARCACFGRAGRPLSRWHLVRNGLLLLVAAGALAGLVLAGDGPVQPPGVLVAVLAGAVIAPLLIRLDDLVELFTPVGAVRPNPSARS